MIELSADWISYHFYESVQSEAGVILNRETVNNSIIFKEAFNYLLEWGMH